MGALIIVVIVVSAAVLSDAGKPFQRIDLDRLPPQLPQNVAVYEGSSIA